MRFEWGGGALWKLLKSTYFIALMFKISLTLTSKQEYLMKVRSNRVMVNNAPIIKPNPHLESISGNTHSSMYTAANGGKNPGFGLSVKP